MNQGTITTHRDELEDWCRAHGWRQTYDGLLAQFSCGDLLVSTSERGTALSGGQWGVDFDRLTPFDVVASAIKAAIAEGGCNGC